MALSPEVRQYIPGSVTPSTDSAAIKMHKEYRAIDSMLSSGA